MMKPRSSNHKMRKGRSRSANVHGSLGPKSRTGEAPRGKRLASLAMLAMLAKLATMGDEAEKGLKRA
jgi:hypothetical protein